MLPVPAHPSSSRRPRLQLAVILALVLQLLVVPTSLADLQGPTDGGRAIITSSSTEEVADGIVHMSYDRIDERGSNHIDVLKVTLSRTTTSYLDSGKVAGVSTLTDMAKRGDVDAAVNGDYFDINNSGAALGSGVSMGQVRKTGNPDFTKEAAVISDGGLGTIANLMLDGRAVVNGGDPMPLLGLNMQKMTDGIAAYDSQWGTFTLTRSLDGGQGMAVRIGKDGKVSAVDVPTSGETTIGEGEHLLLARGATAIATLKALEVGDSVTITVGLTENVDRIRAAISGNTRILESGSAKDGTDLNLHPRTAIGFGDDGATMYLVTVDGRSATSRGMSLPELGRLMKELGATEALNLDGGGSTTMVVRDPGDKDTSVVNTPSDGHERLDGNGLGVTSKASDGKLSGFKIVPSGVTADADRVFPGLHRTLIAKPHDRGGRPVDAAVAAWTSGDTKVATVSLPKKDSVVVTGVTSGSATVTASSGAVAARSSVRVLGKLVRIVLSRETLQLPAKGDAASFSVTGIDEDGYTAPIDPADVSVTGASGDVTITPGTDSTFVATAARDKASGTLTVSVQGKSATANYLVGRDLVVVTDMEEGSEKFSADGARSTQSLATVAGRTGKATAMTMDFSQSKATRTANLRPRTDTTARRDLPGQPVELHAWVKGDGKATPMAYAIFAHAPIVYGPRIKATTDWQEIVFQIPQGAGTPEGFRGLSFYETDAGLQYTTTIAVDDITVLSAPAVDAPTPAHWYDRAVSAAGSTDTSPQRIAVMSDGQFVGRAPNSVQVTGVRNTLRQIVAAKPDAVYIVGDFVDEANDVDFQLARTILDEELVPSGIPWTYVPGNHEVMGQPIANFTKFFGSDTSVKTLGSTRVITLDSSSGRLGDKFDQIKLLRTELDKASTDQNVTGVLVMFHHPTEDFLPDKHSQISDRNEAAMIEDWVERFRATSGKHIGVINGHVGAFNTREQNGVIYHTNGNSGKFPDSTPDWGGWRGWTMLGVNPAVDDKAPATDWLKVETHPFVETGSLTITGPDTVDSGSTVGLSATFTQYGQQIPVLWPVSTRWSGTGVFQGPAFNAPAGAMAAVNPLTNEVTLLPAASGKVTVTLTVNGQSASHTFTVKAPAPTPTPTPTTTPSAPGTSATPTPNPSGAPTGTPTTAPTGTPSGPTSPTPSGDDSGPIDPDTGTLPGDHGNGAGAPLPHTGS